MSTIELRKGFALRFVNRPDDCFKCGGQPHIEKELDGHGAVAVTGVHCGGCDTWAADLDRWNEAQRELDAERGDARTPEHDQ